MTHLSSIGAGIFSDLAVGFPSVDLTATTAAALNSAATFAAVFATEINNSGGTKAAGTFVRIPNPREFPQMGVPANIVNVPRYGFKASGQIQGQADSPTLEVTLNFVGSDWDSATLLGGAIGDGKLRAFRFAMLNAKPAAYGSIAGGLGTVENSLFHFVGKLEAMQFNPQLTDANQATLTISQASDLYGPHSVT